jgi:hypothetical protein
MTSPWLMYKRIYIGKMWQRAESSEKVSFCSGLAVITGKIVDQPTLLSFAREFSPMNDDREQPAISTVGSG